ncbi:LOW QUALITY PROTEIN: hypothetical protein MC885_017760, partial [Smutsia gigantea]
MVRGPVILRGNKGTGPERAREETLSSRKTGGSEAERRRLGAPGSGPPPLPPRPAPLRPQSPMAAAAPRGPAQVAGMEQRMKRPPLSSVYLYKECHRIPKTGVYPKKTCPCEMCGPDLRDILPLAEHQVTHCGQNLYKMGACERQLHFRAKLQHQRQHTEETCFFRSHMSRTCKLRVLGRPFSCRE